MDKQECITTTVNSLLDGTITGENAICLLSQAYDPKPGKTAIHYRSQIHKDTVIQYLKRLRKIYPTGEVDREYLAALYIITSDDEFRRKCLKYVDFEIVGIDFDAMLEKQDFSSGYDVLVRLASNLFNENSQVTPMELIRTLSGEYFELAIQAILLRKFTHSLFEKEL